MPLFPDAPLFDYDFLDQDARDEIDYEDDLAAAALVSDLPPRP